MVGERGKQGTSRGVALCGGGLGVVDRCVVTAARERNARERRRGSSTGHHLTGILSITSAIVGIKIERRSGGT